MSDKPMERTTVEKGYNPSPKPQTVSDVFPGRTSYNPPPRAPLKPVITPPPPPPSKKSE